MAISHLFVVECYAQIRKGEKFMQESRYEQAIKPLRKAFEGDEYDRKAGLLLIESYYRLQRYQEALEVATLMDLENTMDEREAVWYADVLVTNNDFGGAYLNLAKYIGMGGLGEEVGARFEKVADLIKWDTVSTGSTVSDVLGLNTVYNEYAPTISEDGLRYIADHFTVQTMYPSSFTNQSLHLLFFSQQTSRGGFSKPKMLLRSREYYFHDGPLEQIPEEERYALTLREIEGLMYDLKMNIFFTPLTGKEDDLVAFKYNGDYNTGHPGFTEDGNRMYFASDRPGGFGGLDIWYSDFKNGEWTLPVNAGPGVNSASNELYPNVSNQRLFFTSDRRDMGYGGLDLYYVSLWDDNPRPYNLRSPINSAYDDFGIDFSDTKNGYFSSNRTTGFGGDDIYQHYFQPATTRLDSLTFALRNDQNAVKSIRLFDSEGKELKGVADAEGNMVYGSLQTRELYTVKTDSIFSSGVKLVVYNEDDEIVKEFDSNEEVFQVEFLEQEDYELAQKDNEDDSQLFDLGASYGDISVDDSISFKLTSASGNASSFKLYDSDGKIIEGVQKNDLSLVATNIMLHADYTVVADSTHWSRFFLKAYNSDGELLKVFNSDSSTFKIRFLEEYDYILAQEENEDNSEIFDLSGVVLHDTIGDFSNVSVLVKDENGGQIDQVRTDQAGHFEVKNLSYETKYYLSILGIIDSAEIDILGKTGAPVQAAERSAGANTFAYTRAVPEASWMTRTSVKMPMVFAIVPEVELAENEQPNLFAIDSSFARACEVDEDDFIKLGSLTTGRAYELKFIKTSFDPENRLVLLDGYGDTTQTVRPDRDSSFVFELMPPARRYAATETATELTEAEGVGETEEEEVVETTTEMLSNLYGRAAGLAKGGEVSIYNSEKRFLATTYTDEKGRFVITQIPIDSIFFIKSEGVKGVELTSAHHGFSRKGVKSKDYWKFDFTAQKEMDKVVQLDNIYYAFDSHTLTNESKESLDGLYAYLQQNPRQKIKVLSHTDSRGPKAYNEILSNRRAREVVRYLIRKGIDEERLTYEGRGESEPINECAGAVWCPNEKHAENRRTEFVLLKN
jgi:outer membrane protein OmpA-like peptidoglycan-associated protein/tetratricopeptide (TPR) repeat protein